MKITRKKIALAALLGIVAGVLAVQFVGQPMFVTWLREKHGMRFSDGPTMKEDGGGFAFIDAPEGYEIELIQRGNKRGAGGY